MKINNLSHFGDIWNISANIWPNCRKLWSILATFRKFCQHFGEKNLSFAKRLSLDRWKSASIFQILKKPAKWKFTSKANIGFEASENEPSKIRILYSLIPKTLIQIPLSNPVPTNRVHERQCLGFSRQRTHRAWCWGVPWFRTESPVQKKGYSLRAISFNWLCRLGEGVLVWGLQKDDQTRWGRHLVNFGQRSAR